MGAVAILEPTMDARFGCSAKGIQEPYSSAQGETPQKTLTHTPAHPGGADPAVGFALAPITGSPRGFGCSSWATGDLAQRRAAAASLRSR
jgi:hypothetical protein